MDTNNQQGAGQSEGRSMWSTLVIALLAGLIGFFLGKGLGVQSDGLITQNEVDTTTQDSDVTGVDKDATAANSDKNMEQKPIASQANVESSVLVKKEAGQAMAKPGQSTVAVKDQPAGLKVQVSGTLAAPAWVVVHEMNADATVGRILGVQLFDVGAYSGVVELLRGTVAGGRYTAMIHVAGEDHVFDTKKNPPLTDAQGLPVMSSFVAL